jgi:predicted flavoprotein YhiN
MESKIVPGLFITGETLDYDGPCGGYNLNNAWLTGIRAGKGLAR